MGGRVASQMIADGQMDVDRLVFLVYPLHAPGKKDKLRDAHLYLINSPMLFFAGTRDPLCDLALLKGVLDKLPSPWRLETIEGGDHSFVAPKSVKTTQEEIYGQILKKTIDWLSTKKGSIDEHNSTKSPQFFILINGWNRFLCTLGIGLNDQGNCDGGENLSPRDAKNSGIC